MSKRYTVRRLCTEIFLAAAAGMLVLVLPVLPDYDGSSGSTVFLPVVRDAVEGVRLYSLGLLFVLGFTLGVFGRAPVLLVGPATMLAFPICSAIDMLAGGTGHNLWPFEWLFYCVLSLFGLVGAAIGRGARRWWTKGSVTVDT